MIAVIICVFVIIAILLTFPNTVRRPKVISLRGQHVLITGGSSGIGLSLGKLAYTFGADITLVARDKTRLESARNIIQSQNLSAKNRVHILSLDLCSDYSLLKDTLEAHTSHVGPVDILLNCAGYAVSRSFLDMSPDAIRGLIETNYLSSVYVTKILLPGMIENGARDGRILFVCSMAAQVGLYGLAAYAGSKYALRGFAESLRMELECSGPLVTIAFPPDTDTPGFAAENVGKPAVTLEISAAAGLASADRVAQSIFNDVLIGKFISSYGLEGNAVSSLTAGLLPPIILHHDGLRSAWKYLLSAFMEVLAAGPLRAVGIAYATWMRHIVSRHDGRSTSVDRRSTHE